jgi:hypothetical protein
MWCNKGQENNDKDGKSGKVVPVPPANKAYGGGGEHGCIDLRFLDLGTSWS